MLDAVIAGMIRLAHANKRQTVEYASTQAALKPPKNSHYAYRGWFFGVRQYHR